MDSRTNTADRAVGVLRSLNVGMPKDVSWHGTSVHTGIYKQPVTGGRRVSRLNVDGDGQGDLGGHGGEQRAVLVYQQDSYDHWADYLKRDDLVPGSFGENFTVEGLPDDEVCIGDRYRIGEAEFEVTQPRVTCYRVGMRLNEPEMPSLLVSHRRPGFYLRVIREGIVEAGDDVFRTRVGPHALTVADTDALLYLPHRSAEALRKAVQISALSPGWQQSFRELLEGDLAAATVTGPAIGSEPSWDGFRRLTVSGVQDETPSIRSICLKSDSRLEPALPGQYLTVRAALPDGSAAVRSYSISGMPDSSTYRISVKREPLGAVSGYLHDVLAVGVELEVAAPRGEFVLADGAGPLLLVSAGVGATPVLAMLRHLAAEGSDREVWWIHTARDAQDQAFTHEVLGCLAQLQNGHLVTFHTRADTQEEGVITGRPTRDSLAALAIPTDATAYLCGPAGFIGAVDSLLADLGLAPSRVHSELFTALPPINPGLVEHETIAPHEPLGAAGTGPSITFARSGITTHWREEDRSLLELAEACDIPTRWSCRSGVCHTCITPLIAGSVDYRPSPLEQPRPDQVLMCCARPAEDLVIDA